MSSPDRTDAQPRCSWLSAAGRGLAAGLAGTTVMTASLKLEQRVRRRSPGPIDYDATDHVVTAAAAVLRHTPVTPTGKSALSLLAQRRDRLRRLETSLRRQAV